MKENSKNLEWERELLDSHRHGAHRPELLQRISVMCVPSHAPRADCRAQHRQVRREHLNELVPGVRREMGKPPACKARALPDSLPSDETARFTLTQRIHELVHALLILPLPLLRIHQERRRVLILILVREKAGPWRAEQSREL